MKQEVATLVSTIKQQGLKKLSHYDPTPANSALVSEFVNANLVNIYIRTPRFLGLLAVCSTDEEVAEVYDTLVVVPLQAILNDMASDEAFRYTVH